MRMSTRGPPRQIFRWIFSLARRLGSSSMSKRCQRTARSLSADVAHEKCSRLRQVHGDFGDMFVHLCTFENFGHTSMLKQKHGQGNSQDYHDAAYLPSQKFTSLCSRCCCWPFLSRLPVKISKFRETSCVYVLILIFSFYRKRLIEVPWKLLNFVLRQIPGISPLSKPIKERYTTTCCMERS